jgi:hydroxypyruvate isomerase
MWTFSACIEMIFRDLPIEERIPAARACGIPAVEFWGWDNKDLNAIKDAAEACGAIVPVCCVGTADAKMREAYSKHAMLNPANAPLFAEIAEETIERVAPLGIRTLITTTGQERFDVSRGYQRDAVTACLKSAAPVAERHGVTIVLEPLNTLVDHKGYFLSSSGEGFDILRAVGSPNVKLLYDVYHQQITEGNLIDTIRANIGLIGHFHAADVPGRHEPGTGEVNYKNVFKAIGEAGYSGYVGLEYMPMGGAAESLKSVMELI